jgi:hypothetical protein
MVARKVEFTPEMDAVLIEGTERGDGYRPLAERIGVDRCVIERRRKELGFGVAPRQGRPAGVIEWHDRERRTA